MTTSYSDKLRLAIQGTGDNPSTWGQVANQQVFELIEDAISGYLTLDCTTGSDITLSVSNGVADEARNAIIELTGFPTADINIIVPTITKKYIFYTTYSGTHQITIKTSGGTGIAMLTGQKHFVFCDGTNVIDVIPPLGKLAALDTITSASLLGTGVVTTSAIATSAITVSLLDLSTIPVVAVGDFIFSGAPRAARSFEFACDGTLKNRTTEAVLFGVIGTTWGAGDGSTTFQLPNAARRTIVGAGGTGTSVLAAAVGSYGGEESHTQTIPEMPSHDHPSTDGTGFMTVKLPGTVFNGPGGQGGVSTKTAATGGGQPFNVLQPSMVATVFIRRI